jgi:alanine dehydrogenase
LKIGIPREVKEGERRVALLPRDAATLVAAGHEVHIEHGAGAGVGIGDGEYGGTGVRVGSPRDAWGCELIVKVKEMLAPDLDHASSGQAIFGFHQLPRFPERTRALAARGITAIAYELVRDAQGGFPLLAPMSVISGRMALEAVWRFLPAEPRAVVLGAGNAGLSAARAAAERGARVLVLTRTERSRDAARAQGFDAELSTAESVEAASLGADLVVGAVLRRGEPTPKLIRRDLVRRMKRGAVIADICIDGGGVAETSRPTTHAAPTYVEEGVVHYAIANIPGADPLAATQALSAAVRPFALELASRGIEAAMRENGGLRGAVLLWKGRVNHPGLAAEAGLPYRPLSEEDLA